MTLRYGEANVQPSLVIGLPDAALYSGQRILFIFIFIRSPSVLLQNSSCQSTTKLKRLLSAFFLQLHYPHCKFEGAGKRGLEYGCYLVLPRDDFVYINHLIYDFIQRYFLLPRRPTTL